MTLFESPLTALQQFEESYQQQHVTSSTMATVPFPFEDRVFGKCDCTSYSYLALSVALFAVGSAITIFALGDVDGHIFSNLGHMWAIGPIFICSGLMVAVKCMLYLRKKSVIQLIIHHHQHFQDPYQCSQEVMVERLRAEIAVRNVNPNSIGAPAPPPYDVITQGTTSTELPPPSYAEAVALLQQSSTNDMKTNCEAVSSSTETRNVQSKP